MPLSIYVEPTAIERRPKMIQSLRNLGAQISQNPRDASVILVNDDTPCGQQFLRDWKSQKVVLKSLWAIKSQDAGRLLSAHDDWANCLAEEKVLNEDVDNNRIAPLVGTTVESRHTLPTPRGTPSKSGWTNVASPLLMDNRHPTLQGHATPESPNRSLVPHSPQDVFQGSITSLCSATNPLSHTSASFMNCKVATSFQDVSSLHASPTSSAFGPMTNATENATTIFQHGGEPYTFFVQIDLKPRKPLITLIKKHGGEMSPSITDADFAVLDSRSQPFTKLLETRHQANKDAVKANFIHDCIDQGTLMDPTSYYFLFDDKVNGKGRGKAVSSKSPRKALTLTKKSVDNNLQSTSPSHPVDLVELQTSTFPNVMSPNESTPSCSESKTSLVLNVKSQSPVVRAEANMPGRSTPSPSPPAGPKVFLNQSQEKYVFTEEECQWAYNYVSFLLKRDISISRTIASQKLAEKMPHHSKNSWYTTLFCGRRRVDMDAIWKKAQIAYRKAQLSNTTFTSAVNERLRTYPNLIGPESSQRGKKDRRSMEELARQDFETIWQFLLFEGGDNGDEPAEVTLAHLQTPCKSAISWVKFLDIHEAEIHAGYHELAKTISDRQ